jgi:hypothetical protein
VGKGAEEKWIQPSVVMLADWWTACLLRLHPLVAGSYTCLPAGGVIRQQRNRSVLNKNQELREVQKTKTWIPLCVS